ncbi:MAG: hypothetical protein QW286_02985 [Candidatus Aenigmatarchaeota archaeon]
MARERIAAIVIGIIMVMSAAGFAINSALYQNRQENIFNIPTIVTRQLTVEESVYILRTGRVIIEFFYDENCSDCQERIGVIEGFAQKMSGFAVLQEIKGNETSVKMIGSEGRIVDIMNESLSETDIMRVFCEIAITQPPECLIEENVIWNG